MKKNKAENFDKNAEWIYHFGVHIKKKSTNKINRQDYAIINNKCTPLGFMAYFTPERKELMEQEIKIYTDSSRTKYTDEWCEAHREKCLQNYDLNMKYFEHLSKDEFEQAIKEFLLKNPQLKKVKDLKEYKKVEGIYMLILDEYKQLYIGSSIDIKRRIMSHWSRTKEFDRLLYGSINNSILSIDSFGALDTTRIYAYTTGEFTSYEAKLVSDVPDKFKLNRTAGGIRDDNYSPMAIVYGINTRNME